MAVSNPEVPLPTPSTTAGQIPAAATPRKQQKVPWYTNFVFPLNDVQLPFLPVNGKLPQIRNIFDNNRVVSHKPHMLPHEVLPEVAFLGRANVGKSSLINSLLGRTSGGVARTSKRAGCTTQLYFYSLCQKLTLVDMPGYGATSRQEWNEPIRKYLESRNTLRCVYVLIDSRHPPFQSDLFVLAKLEDLAIPHSVVLTKIDKVSTRHLAASVKQLETILLGSRHCTGYVNTVSGFKMKGIDALRATIAMQALEAGSH